MSDTSSRFDIIWDAEQDEPPSLSIDAFLNDLLDRLELEHVELAVVITSDAVMRQYNHRYRGKDAVTDVLSFPQSDLPTQGGIKHLGDIVISFDQAHRQAEQLGHGTDRELRFLILHGLLHLLGYDHETDQGEMLAYQRELKNELACYF